MSFSQFVTERILGPPGGQKDTMDPFSKSLSDVWECRVYRVSVVRTPWDQSPGGCGVYGRDGGLKCLETFRLRFNNHFVPLLPGKDTTINLIEPSLLYILTKELPVR